MRNTPHDTIRSVEKALRILRAFDSHTPDRGLTEISASLGLPKSVAHKLLQTLAGAGFLQQDPVTRRYRIGASILAVAGAFLNTNPLLREGPVVVQHLAATTGHTSALGILDGPDVLYVATTEGTQAIKATARIGDRRPLHATATGKVLLAGLPDQEVDRLIGRGPLLRFTPKTITDLAALRQELRTVRRTGIAYNFGERAEAVSAVAAAVYDHGQRVVAGISVILPFSSRNRRVLDEFTRHVAAHARELSRRIGAGEPDVRETNAASARGRGAR